MRLHLIYNPNGRALAGLRVHKAGCPDIERHLAAATSHYEGEFDSQRDAAADFYSDFIAEGSMTVEDAMGHTYFVACTDGLPERAVAADYAMTYMGPQVVLPAGTFGTVGVKFIRSRLAYVEAGAESGNGPGKITYRGKNYYLVAHLWAEHGWDEDPADRSRMLFAPPSYRKTIMAAIVTAVRDYAAAHPLVLVAADINDLEHQQERALAELAEARRAFEEKREQVTGLSARLTELRRIQKGE